MCQSKAEGGIRCSSHAIEALQKHHDKQAEMVKEYAAKNGKTLPDESKLYNDFEHRTAVYSKVNEVAAYKKVERDFYSRNETERKAKFDLASVSQHQSVSSISAFLWKHDALAKETLAARDKAWENGDEVEAEKNIAKLQSLRARTVNEAENIVSIVKNHGAYQLVNVLREQGKTPRYLNEIYEKNESAKNTFNTVRAEVVAKEKQRFISKKFRNSPEYKEIATSTDFRKQPEVRQWEERAAELQRDYSMTSDYRQKLEDMASFYQEGTEDRERIETQIRKVDTLKKMTILKNKREAEMESSKETVNA